MTDNQQQFLDQIKRMNELAMENMMNQARQKRLNKKFKQNSGDMFKELQSQMPLQQNSDDLLKNLQSQLPNNTGTNSNSNPLGDLMGMLNNLNK